MCLRQCLTFWTAFARSGLYVLAVTRAVEKCQVVLKVSVPRKVVVRLLVHLSMAVTCYKVHLQPLGSLGRNRPYLGSDGYNFWSEEAHFPSGELSMDDIF
jgi:hypothetical protein